ncbi:hypothetical protein HU200_050051 [Digitaria exilis]|uniref:Plant bHLH transcription factor ACT-like domain-containing protein n=1 Tax=Digitaria exilis TaxID=1010633 RepID=A0A835B3J1_9POAL|nr:hypothetical protein HU200_050051 [Digitaria exilis]
MQANKTSILVDASKYIKDLKEKVEEAASASAAGDSTSVRAMAATVCKQVSVSSVELDSNSSSSCRRRGFRINVSMERSRPGLLVLVLEVLEELGLDILDADISCADHTAFRLQALGSGQGESMDEQMVRQAVLQAISKCMDND